MFLKVSSLLVLLGLISVSSIAAPLNTPSLKPALNLSDVLSAATARSNLGTLYSVPGNQTQTTGSLMKILNQTSDSALDPKFEGGIWPGNTIAYYALAHDFALGDGVEPAPAILGFDLVRNNGVNADVVARLSDCIIIATSAGSCFGGNMIARTGSGISGKLVGLELDIEPAPGTLATAGSIGLAVNAYSSAVAGPGIQLGGLGGGTFANGIVCAAIAAAGSCLAPGTGSGQMASMMNSTNATLGTAAIVIGNAGGTGTTGAGQRITFTGSDGLAAAITTDNNQYMKIATATHGLVITNQPQTANLFLFDATTGNLNMSVSTGAIVGNGPLNLRSSNSTITFQSHVAATGTAPTVSTCGTSPTVSATASDRHGTITPGAGATTCTITFATAYASAPDVLVSGAASATAPFISSISSTVLVVGFGSVGKFSYSVEQ